MFNWLEIPGIPITDAAVSAATCPAAPFFLQREFLEKYWKLAFLPEERLPQVIAFAGKVQNDPGYRMLAWHLYRHFNFNLLRDTKCQEMPDILPELGEESGMFYLLCALSLIPGFIDRAKRENFPLKYGENAAKRFGSLLCFREQLDGTFGLRPRSITFMLHYLQSALWRIGRFDFVISKADSTIPEVYRKGSEIIAFCAEGTMLGSDNDRVNDPELAIRTAHIEFNDSKVTGIPIDVITGKAKDEPLSLELDQWERVAGPGDWTLFFHIPGGGGMTPELCRESFAEVKEFVKSYCPDKKFTLCWSVSWIFNPAWKEELPESNLAALIRRGRLFPAESGKNPGLYFVFGHDDGDPDSFTAGTSLQRAVLKCYRENRLRRTGWFVLPDEI